MHDLVEAIASKAGIAMFPLPRLSLFPGQLLPLHIFEPRYRAMCRDSTEGQSFWVMGHLRPGFESQYQERPAIYSIAGVGRTVGIKELDDGRYLVALRGLARVRITKELAPDQPYRKVRVSLLDSEQGASAELLGERVDELMRTCEQLISSTGGSSTSLRAHLDRCNDPFLKVDLLAAAMAPGPESQRSLLETLDPLERCDKLQALLTRVMNADESDPQLN